MKNRNSPFLIEPDHYSRNTVITKMLQGLDLERYKIFPCFKKNHLNHAFRTRFRFVSDFFISEYDTNVHDRKVISQRSIRAHKQYWLDYLYFHASWYLLADTRQHFEYWQSLFGRRTKETFVLPVLADRETYYPRSPVDSDTQTLRVLFYGTFIPLHGLDKIIEGVALAQRRDVPVHLTIIGRGQVEGNVAEQLRAHALESQVTWIRDIVQEAELVRHIEKNDVVLGIFGDSTKARSVVPNKVYQALACERCVLTADTPGVREFFDENQVRLCRPDAASIAEALIKLQANPAQIRLWAECGRHAFESLYSDTEKKFRQFVIDINR